VLPKHRVQLGARGAAGVRDDHDCTLLQDFDDASADCARERGLVCNVGEHGNGTTRKRTRRVEIEPHGAHDDPVASGRIRDPLERACVAIERNDIRAQDGRRESAEACTRADIQDHIARAHAVSKNLCSGDGRGPQDVGVDIDRGIAHRGVEDGIGIRMLKHTYLQARPDLDQNFVRCRCGVVLHFGLSCCWAKYDDTCYNGCRRLRNPERGAGHSSADRTLAYSRGCEVQCFDDAAAFLAQAREWLLRRESEHNLLLGLAQQIRTGTTLFQEPIYLAVIRQNDEIVGCAFRTPPYKLGLTRLPVSCIPDLVDSVARVYDSIPAVMGDGATARAFASEWAERFGCTAHEGMRHRIYELNRVIPPARPAAGSARVATMRDAALVTTWIEAFSLEATLHTEHADRLAVARIRQRSMYLWELDDMPVSMAAWSGETPNGRRVGYVYTPPAHRARGYATSLVAQLSQRILDEGSSFCFLYTDLGNPTSNDIYQQIGYRPVCDVTDWRLECA
jgi:uncharacterized protein